MIKVATSGFPVGRNKYEAKFKTVELSQMFDRFPRPSTVEKWRAECPKDFEFVVCASKSITHPEKNAGHKVATRSSRQGYFQASAEVGDAYRQTLSAARTLKSRLILFQLPRHLTAHPDSVGRLQKFVQASDHRDSDIHLVWEPPPTWSNSFVESISASLRLIPAMNPLAYPKRKIKASLRYFRLGKDGRTSGIHAFTDSELKEVKAACDTPLSYVIFNNGPTSFQDAVRFSNLVEGNSSPRFPVGR